MENKCTMWGCVCNLGDNLLWDILVIEPMLVDEAPLKIFFNLPRAAKITV